MGSHLPGGCRKVVFVLEELGLNYDTVYLDLAKGESRSPEFLKINPNGRIPALIDHGNDDFIIWCVCVPPRLRFA